jgi:hypothetical protein
LAGPSFGTPILANLKGVRRDDMRHTAITNVLMNPEISLETAKSIRDTLAIKIIRTVSAWKKYE